MHRNTHPTQQKHNIYSSTDSNIFYRKTASFSRQQKTTLAKNISSIVINNSYIIDSIIRKRNGHSKKAFYIIDNILIIRTLYNQKSITTYYVYSCLTKLKEERMQKWDIFFILKHISFYTVATIYNKEGSLFRPPSSIYPTSQWHLALWNWIYSFCFCCIANIRKSPYYFQT